MTGVAIRVIKTVIKAPMDFYTPIGAFFVCLGPIYRLDLTPGNLSYVVMEREKLGKIMSFSADVRRNRALRKKAEDIRANPS